MKVHGNLVYLDMPEITNIKDLQLSPDAKKAMMETQSKKFHRLKVFAKSDQVTNVEVGDEVLVNPAVLSKILTIEIDGKDKIPVSSFDIMHTW